MSAASQTNKIPPEVREALAPESPVLEAGLGAQHNAVKLGSDKEYTGWAARSDFKQQFLQRVDAVTRDFAKPRCQQSPHTSRNSFNRLLTSYLGCLRIRPAPVDQIQHIMQLPTIKPCSIEGEIGEH